MVTLGSFSVGMSTVGYPGIGPASCGKIHGPLVDVGSCSAACLAKPISSENRNGVSDGASVILWSVFGCDVKISLGVVLHLGAGPGESIQLLGGSNNFF